MRHGALRCLQKGLADRWFISILQKMLIGTLGCGKMKNILFIQEYHLQTLALTESYRDVVNQLTSKTKREGDRGEARGVPQ